MPLRQPAAEQMGDGIVGVVHGDDAKSRWSSSVWLRSIAWLPGTRTVSAMSNNMYVQLPGWVGPGVTQSILEDILGGGGIEPHCYPEQTSCPDLGCWITLNLKGLGVKRQFFFHADGDAFGRRLITTRDCPFWRTVLGQLVAVVGGTLRNEYRPDPELTIKPTRSRLDLDDDDNWLMRRAQRHALDDPDAVGRLE